MIQIIRNIKCNRCNREDERGSVITPNFKPEGYVCSECAKEYCKIADDMANKFSSGLDITKTLRDEFAMAALGTFAGREGHMCQGDIDQCYAIADAMLEARKAKGE